MEKQSLIFFNMIFQIFIYRENKLLLMEAMFFEVSL